MEDFLSRVHPEPMSGCWLWTGGTTAGGYGVSHRRYAHRESYRLHYGEIPDGLCVLHKCDTPPCVNPRHLFLGTRTDNAADKTRKGRAALRPEHVRRGERHHQRRLTSGAVRDIRFRAARGERPGPLAIAYAVDRSTIDDVLGRRTWRHVE